MRSDSLYVHEPNYNAPTTTRTVSLEISSIEFIGSHQKAPLGAGLSLQLETPDGDT